jgi:hypothetical protein
MSLLSAEFRTPEKSPGVAAAGFERFRLLELLAFGSLLAPPAIPEAIYKQNEYLKPPYFVLNSFFSKISLFSQHVKSNKFCVYCKDQGNHVSASQTSIFCTLGFESQTIEF